MNQFVLVTVTGCKGSLSHSACRRDTDPSRGQTHIGGLTQRQLLGGVACWGGPPTTVFLAPAAGSLRTHAHTYRHMHTARSSLGKARCCQQGQEGSCLPVQGPALARLDCIQSGTECLEDAAGSAPPTPGLHVLASRLGSQAGALFLHPQRSVVCRLHPQIAPCLILLPTS